jgi:hypothetical protein
MVIQSSAFSTSEFGYNIPIEWTYDPGLSRAKDRISSLLPVVPDFFKFMKDKPALDIRAGSPIAEESNIASSIGDSSFLRYLYSLGIYGIGVDINPALESDKEYFHHIQGNLLRLLLNQNLSNSINNLGIESGSIGLINSDFSLSNVGPIMWNMAGRSWSMLEKIEELLIHRSYGILSAGGILYLGDKVYVKDGEGLKLV